MSKKLLVIGGSYYAGRIFVLRVQKEPDTELFVLNRGKHPLNLPGVTELKCDRRDAARMKELLGGREFDTVVDFCAYEPGDIDTAMEALGGKAHRYIYISTASGYETSPFFPKTEQSPAITEAGSDPVTRYVWKKRQLEGELQKACARHGAAYTVLRPAFLYGPFNYVPMEAYYFERIIKGIAIHVPEKCLSLFQFVYVEDMAEAILLCAESDAARNNVYNLAAPELVCYESYMEVLRQITDREFRTVPVPVEKVYSLKIPLPFPLESHELYSGEKIARDLGLTYTPFPQGMRETYEASKHIWI